MIKKRKYCNKKEKLLQSLPNVQKSPFHNSDTPQYIRKSAITIAPTSALSRFTICDLIIDKS